MSIKRFKLTIILVILIGSLISNSHLSTFASGSNPELFTNEVSIWPGLNLDPATYNGSGFVPLVYEGLLRLIDNSAMTFSESLAFVNYTVSSDGFQYTFWLKTGISFSYQSGETIGQPFNAYVMQYSIDRAILMNDFNSQTHSSIAQYILGADVVSTTLNMNITQAQTFLNLQSIRAIDMYKLQFNITRSSTSFLQALQSTGASAISPKAIIDNEPSSYNTNISDTEFGMVPLTYFFPGMNNATILNNLGLPSNYDLMNSGVVPSSPANVDSPNEYTWTNTHSAGTGPWVVSTNTPDIGASIVNNPNYWNNASLPTSNLISMISWKQVSSATTRISDLENGKADYVDIPAENISQLINTSLLQPLIPNIQVNQILSFDGEAIGFNMFPTISGGIISENSSSNYALGTMNYTNLVQYTWNMTNGTRYMASPGNPFTSLLFREAFANVFDYSYYISAILQGLAIRMQGAIPKGLFGAQQALINNGYIPNFDLATAKSLFSQVGFKGSITLFYSNDSIFRKESVQILKNTIEGLNVGISINIQTVSWSQYLTNAYNHQLPLLQLQLVQGLGFIDADSLMTQYYGNQTNNGFYSLNTNYDNPYVNELISQASAATTTIAKLNLYTQIEENATQDFPYIYVDQPIKLLVTSSKIHGLSNSDANSLSPFFPYPNYQYLTKDPTILTNVSTSSTGFSTSLTSNPVFPTTDSIILIIPIPSVPLSFFEMIFWGLVLFPIIAKISISVHKKKKKKQYNIELSSSNYTNLQIKTNKVYNKNIKDDFLKENISLYILIISPILKVIATVYKSYRHKNLTYFELQENPLRTNILNILEKEHFVHFNKLKSLLNCSVGSLKWHIQVLQEFNLINWSRIGQYKVIYLADSTPKLQEVNLYYATQNKNITLILDNFLLNNTLSLNELVTLLPIRKDYIQYHLKKLIQIEIIQIKERNVFLCQRKMNH